MLAVFQKVLHLSLTGSLIALAVICIRPLLRKAPKWMLCLLWGLVALRLVCPISPESSLSLVPQRVATGQIISNVASVPMQDPAPYTDDTPSDVLQEEAPIDGPYYIYPIQTPDVPTLGEKLFPLFSRIWLAGVVVMLTYSVISYALLKRRMGEATLLRDNIWQCEAVDSPFVLGFIRPKIYLPYRISEVDMAHVIAHERSHIHRRDHWWKPIGFVLLSIHWFNPVLWLSYLLLCRDIEAACDERVIHSMEKEEKQAYSTALLHCSVHRTAIAACPLAFGEVSVKERVKNVMHYKKPAFLVMVLAVAVCIVVAVCFLTNPRTPSMEVLPLVHSHSYGVVEATYESPTLGVRELLDARFRITEAMEFGLKSANVSYTGWVDLGTLTETRLTRENFDRLFLDNSGWFQNENAAYIRQNAAHVWELVREDQERFFYLIQLKNGELFLAAGYYDTAEKDDPGSDDTAVSVLYRLGVELEEDYNIIARSGENTVPLTIFPSGTAIGNYAKAVQWLTIDPGEDFSPFRVYQNGEELMGHYLVFDAQTHEQLSYMIPSGLDPQTYLFQNADPEREYIVVMMRGYEPDTEIYCFGARFDRENPSILRAQLLQIQDDCYLVRPISGSQELESADLIQVPASNLTDSSEPRVGDILRIAYRGKVLETYPARLEQVYEITVWERSPDRRWYILMPDTTHGVSEIEITGNGIHAVVSKSDGSDYEPGETVWLDPMEGIDDLRGMTISARDAQGNKILNVGYPETWEHLVTWVQLGDFRIDSIEEQSPEVRFMQPTDSALEGIYDRYLYLTLDGAKYRYERQDTMPGGIQASEQIATVYEDNGLGERYYYTVFSVAGSIDHSMLLVHSQDMDMMWLYRYSPPKACAPVELHNAINSGFVVMEDGSMTHGQQLWQEFLHKTRQGTAATVRLAHYYTLDPSRCSDAYYEAYREDYPSLFLQELCYDGRAYTLRNIGGEESYSRTYEYLMCYTDRFPDPQDRETQRTAIRYVLTHDDTLTWAQIWSSLISSQSDAHIDHYIVISQWNE